MYSINTNEISLNSFHNLKGEDSFSLPSVDTNQVSNLFGSLPTHNELIRSQNDFERGDFDAPEDFDLNTREFNETLSSRRVGVPSPEIKNCLSCPKKSKGQSMPKGAIIGSAVALGFLGFILSLRR